MDSVVRLLADYGPAFGQALLLTWKLTAMSFVAGFALGTVVTVARLLPLRPLRFVLTGYVEVFRNIPSAALLATHAGVAEAMAGAPDRPDLTLPGRWTPHVTLARRLDDAQLAQALDLLADVPRELVGEPSALRHWDSDTKTVHVLSSR